MRGFVGVGPGAERPAHRTQQVVVDPASANQARIRLPAGVAQRGLLLGVGRTFAGDIALGGLVVALVHQAEPDHVVTHALRQWRDRTRRAATREALGARVWALPHGGTRDVGRSAGPPEWCHLDAL